MDYYFNELSANSLANKGDALDWVTTFAETCMELNRFNFNLLRSDIFIELLPVSTEMTIGNWLKNRSQNRELKQRFRSIVLSKQPIISDSEANYEAYEWAIFKHKNQEAKGLGIAALNNSIAVSFPSHADWKMPNISIEKEYLDDENNEQNVTISVRHASQKKHVETHKDFILEKLKTLPIPQDWRPADNPLPNVKLAEKVLNIAAFYEAIQAKNRGEKMAQFKIMGAQVAELNYYERDAYLCKINSSKERIREIFVSKNTLGNKGYLSIDFEKGAFEVCDYNGKHQGEMLFGGEWNGEAKSDHDIKLKN